MLVGTAAILAAVFVWLWFTLPPEARRPDLPLSPLMATGALHVHTERSDGWGSLDDVARAAAAAGLQFVVVTDHGDASRAPETPVYRHGVLLIDAVEISAAGGHIVALGLWDAAPYPLGGEARDVVEDIHRLGGRAIAAHMDSPKEDLRWTAPLALPDGIEWLNVDSEWRRHPPAGLGPSVGRLFLRPAETVASLFGDGRENLQAWDQLTQSRDVFSVAAVDAHTRVPSYEAVFRGVAQTVMLDAPLSGQAPDDARRITASLSTGRSFSMIRAFVDAPHALEFTATAARGLKVGIGRRVPAPDDVTLRARVPEAVGAATVELIRNGTVVASANGSLEHATTAPGIYRVQVRLADRPAPWVVANPIYIGERPAVVPKAAGEPQGRAIPVSPASWVVEAHADSRATVSAGEHDVRFSYQLAAGGAAGQYAAFVAPGAQAVQSVELVASSPRPARVSVQARAADGRRWRRSVYLDATPRRIVIPLTEMTSTAPGGAPIEGPAALAALLIVVDTVNAAPGTSGDVVIRGLSFRSVR